MPKAVAGIGQGIRRRLDRLSPGSHGLGGLPQITTYFLIKPLIRVLDAVFDGFQFALREELMLPGDQHIGAPDSVQVFLEAREVNGLMRYGVEAIPAQDVI